MNDTESNSRGWLVLAGVGVATTFYLAWLKEKSHHRKVLAVRERARLVPLRQARTEADQTRQAVSYAGGAKGG